MVLLLLVLECRVVKDGSSVQLAPVDHHQHHLVSEGSNQHKHKLEEFLLVFITVAQIQVRKAACLNQAAGWKMKAEAG